MLIHSITLVVFLTLGLGGTFPQRVDAQLSDLIKGATEMTKNKGEKKISDEVKSQIKQTITKKVVENITNNIVQGLENKTNNEVQEPPGRSQTIRTIPQQNHISGD